MPEIAALNQSEQQKPITSVRINDVVIKIATANGSGSQSANQVITRAIFQMGVPVSAKNAFPSNIQGLPTWYSIRVSKEGWTGRRGRTDVLIGMNPASAEEDLASLPPGAIAIVRDDLAGFVKRDDLKVVVVPFTKLVEEACPIPKLRRLIVNMMYVGVLAHLLQIDMDEVIRAIGRVFKGKEKAVQLNADAARKGYEWAKENVEPSADWRIQAMEATEGKILIDGNSSCALGAIWGGATVLAWYPITPSSSVAETMIKQFPKLRTDPETGRATYAVVQAEDELSSIGIVVGAGWAGARALTATSGPGISLMAEIAGLSYFAEIPAVIVDVQRMGPSTGLPTRTCQNDIMKAYYLSHGDCKHLLLIPANQEECFEFSCESFNVAERFQTLVFVMTDLDMGMNIWMSEKFTYPSKPIDRGKVLDAEALEKLGGEWGRYRDVDGDGIPWRTLPGTPHPSAAYFTRGTGHTDRATYSEKAAEWQRNMERLVRKFETARRELPAPVLQDNELAEIGVIAYGSSDPAVKEALATLATDHGLEASYLRVRALPAHASVYEFIEQYEVTYLVEQNRDAQMASILRAERPDLAARIRSVLHFNGLALDAQTVVDQIAADHHARQQGSK